MGSQNCVAGAISHDVSHSQKELVRQTHHARMTAVRRCISQNRTDRAARSAEPAGRLGLSERYAVKVSRHGKALTIVRMLPFGPEDSGAPQQSAGTRWLPPGSGPQASSTSPPPGSIRAADPAGKFPSTRRPAHPAARPSDKTHPMICSRRPGFSLLLTSWCEGTDR